ncbi:MAG: FGGY family carbohydrate kinase [Pseudomonadota bacterium]|nr:FGGY family carbohydrate kinase [Pseudomonadota bacterium]
MSFFLGIDLGASALKLSLIDTHAQYVGGCGIGLATDTPEPGHAEQNPADWRTALQSGLGQLHTDFPKEVQALRAIVFTGGAHIAVLCDDANKPLRPAIMWSDQRAAAQANQLRKDQEIIKISGNQPNPTWTLPQLCWLQEHEPDLMARLARVFFAKDWLRAQLTGDRLTDMGEATGAMLGDIRGSGWATQILTQAGIKKPMMAELVSPLAKAGTTDARAQKFHLPSGVAIYQGSIDTTVEWLCCGAPKANKTHIKLASAGVVSKICKGLAPRPPVSIYPHLAEPLYYHAAGMNNCTSALDWFAKTFAPIQTLDQIADIAADAPAGADGVLFHPYLLGERAPHWSPDLTASFTGMTRATNQSHLARAVFEGIGHALTQIWHSMDIAASEATVLGGGAQSAFWCQMIADMTGAVLRVPEHTDASFGAALLAAHADGAFDTLATAAEAGFHKRAEFSPDKQAHACYIASHKVYRAAFEQFHRQT